MMEKNLIDEAHSKGLEVEKNIDRLKSGQDDTIIIDYHDITSVKIDKGFAIKMPRLEITAEQYRFRFELAHDNYDGTGKLDSQVFESYHSTLRKALGDKLQ